MAASVVSIGPGTLAAYASNKRLRPAAASHRGLVLEMMLAYLRDAEGDILPCQENLDTYGAIFDRYMTGEAEGAVILAVDGDTPGRNPDDQIVGFTIGGEFPMGFVTSHGKVAMGWGTYVLPEYRRRGHAQRLRLALDSRLRGLGFDSILAGYAVTNDPARESLKDLGFRVYQVLGVKSLKRGA